MAGKRIQYSAELADAVCAKVAEGMAVIAIGKLKDMPSETTIYKWLSTEAEFAEKYARAREAQADVYSQEIVDIADTATNDDYNVARLKIDARKWAASKLAPKKYGDKLNVQAETRSTVVLTSDSDRL